MADKERLLAALDSLREQIAAGTHSYAWTFVWASDAHRQFVPFITPKDDTTIHFVLSIGTGGELVLAEHGRAMEALKTEIIKAPPAD